MTEAHQRILLVDDDDEILESTQLALEEHGYEVLTARDGSEALIRAERDSPRSHNLGRRDAAPQWILRA